MAFAVYDNDPALGYIRWSDLHIQYQGVTYAITDGHTAYRFVWWDPDVSTTDLQVADTLPTLSDDAILVFLNKDGVHVTVPRSTVVDGSLIVSESILADALAANSVVSDKIAAGAIVSSKIGAEEILGIHILAGEIDTNHIAANAVTANKIAANTITSNELAADAVTANELAALNVGVGKYIRSTTYTPGSDGWSIDADGTAEFNDVTVRGTVAATSFDGTGTNLLSGMTAADWVFESGSGTVTKIDDNTYEIKFTTAGGVASPYIKSLANPYYSLHTITVIDSDDPLNGNAHIGLEQDNGGYLMWIALWPNAPDFWRVAINTVSDGVRFVLGGQAGRTYTIRVEAIDPARLGGVITTESTRIIGNLDLNADAAHYGHGGNLTLDGAVVAGGVVVARGNVSTTDGQFMAPNGSAAAPAYTFASDTDTGLYRVGTNQVGIAAAGSVSASFTSNSARFSDGTAAAPGIAFRSDTNTGILRSAADTMQFSCGGTVKLALAPSAVLVDLPASATSYQPVHRDATFGTLVRFTSSRRFKERIETFDGADLVPQLRPVTFYPKEGHGDTSRQSVGFIAEEVADVDTRLTTTGPDGEPDGLDTNAMLAALVAEVQSLRKRVADLEANVDA